MSSKTTNKYLIVFTDVVGRQNFDFMFAYTERQALNAFLKVNRLFTEVSEVIKVES